MNIKTTLIVIIVAVASCIRAADKASYTYEGEVAGVMCNACVSHVKAALSKLDGVSSVEITPSKSGSVPHLQVVSSSSKLTKDLAVKALGDQAKMYVIQSFQLVTK